MLELWLLRHIQTIWNALFGTTGITRLRLGGAKTPVSRNDTAHLLGSGLGDDGA